MGIEPEILGLPSEYACYIIWNLRRMFLFGRSLWLEITVSCYLIGSFLEKQHLNFELKLILQNQYPFSRFI